MPPPAAVRPSRRRQRARVISELTLGLLLGIVGGWVAGLVRVRRP